MEFQWPRTESNVIRETLKSFSRSLDYLILAFVFLSQLSVHALTIQFSYNPVFFSSNHQKKIFVTVFFESLVGVIIHVQLCIPLFWFFLNPQRRHAKVSLAYFGHHSALSLSHTQIKQTYEFVYKCWQNAHQHDFQRNSKQHSTVSQ